MHRKSGNQGFYKLGRLEDGHWVEHVHLRHYRLPQPDAESQRIVAGVPYGDPEIFSRLVDALEAPYYLLYLLHTPRGEGLPGRYQSPPIDQSELHAFLKQFEDYLSGDARFDLWAHAPSENATVVWDRHNQVFAYGPLSRFELVLQRLGFVQGSLEIGVPHAHNYREELDAQAALVLKALEWTHSPLREQDEQ